MTADDGTMNTIGRHLIVEYYGCDCIVINDVSYIEEAMSAAALAVGATIVGKTFHHFAPQGVSGTVVIAESHLSCHTWPESGYVSVDIYTCGGLNPSDGFELLAERFSATAARVQEIIRGLPEDLPDSMNEYLCSSDVQVMSKISDLKSFTDEQRSKSAS